MDLGWYLSVLVAFYAAHSLLATDRVKAVSIARFPFLARYYRLLYNLQSLLGLSVVGWSYHRLGQQRLFDPGGWRWLGAGFILFGCFVSVAALYRYDLGYFSGWRQLSAPGSTEFAKLETKGWNGRVRHPLYFGLLLGSIGGFLYFPTDVHLATAASTIVYLIIGSRLEERKLAVQFGDAYREYQAKVPPLIPFRLRRRK